MRIFSGRDGSGGGGGSGARESPCANPCLEYGDTRRMTAVQYIDNLSAISAKARASDDHADNGLISNCLQIFLEVWRSTYKNFGGV